MSTWRDGHKICALLIVLLPTLVWCQANVNENLETASIYVDGATGSDSNPGTQSQPLQTIGAAALMASNNNYQSIGSKVIINPGTYRESVTIGKTFRTTSLPITFGAATPGTVTVSGADVWTDWVAYSGNSSIYTQAWPYQWGECASTTRGPTEQNIVLRHAVHLAPGRNQHEYGNGRSRHTSHSVHGPRGVQCRVAGLDLSICEFLSYECRRFLRE
jgi:hypothetical protein